MVAVSVCLPVYNGERYLPEAVESALSQTFTDFELIIVDDCSTDSSFELAQKYAALDSRVRVFRNDSNIGLFQNYNRCLDLARGDYIKPFAQDDLFDRFMLEMCVRILRQHPNVALVSTAKRWIDDRGTETKIFQQFPESRTISGKEVIRYNLIQLTNWVGEPSTVMFRASLRGTGFDTRLFHYGDIDYWFRIAEKHDYYYLNEVQCSFRRHGASATSRNLNGLYFALDILRLGKKYRSYLEEIGESEEHFSHRAMEVISLNVDHLVRHESLDLATCIDARPSQLAIDEVGSFKELSFHSLRYINVLLGKISDLEHRMEDQRQSYERQIESMQQSTSWRITAPLRNLAKARGGM